MKQLSPKLWFYAKFKIQIYDNSYKNQYNALAQQNSYLADAKTSKKFLKLGVIITKAKNKVRVLAKAETLLVELKVFSILGWINYNLSYWNSNILSTCTCEINV